MINFLSNVLLARALFLSLSLVFGLVCGLVIARVDVDYGCALFVTVLSTAEGCWSWLTKIRQPWKSSETKNVGLVHGVFHRKAAARPTLITRTVVMNVATVREQAECIRCALCPERKFT